MHKKVFAFLFAIFLLVLTSQNSFCAWWQSEGEERETNYFLSLNAGYNALLKGYDNYDNYSSFGADLVFIKEPSLSFTEASWKENFYYRISLDYMPLLVPAGTYGTTEDLLAVSGDMMYNIFDGAKSRLFAGVGLGCYMDTISVDTPATGQRSTSYIYFGYKPSLGWAIKAKKDFEIIPEVRYHSIFMQNGYFANNVVYQVGLCWKLN